ncbi:uncharacterized protein LOC112087745 [Eutrema salsugineum]|uniref:uncharacterized protein LOC112087745 n=1 Tax=Eutrema salsugineum TaxID=72664 RepID=UPI000CED0333|nr:uncharacterized protein LOC112087745 [Eutrema salsugineum]
MDIVGHVVNVGKMETLEAANKPTKKLEFELRDENDERLGCTLWGSFAEKVYEASENANGEMVICLIRFAKIKEFRETMYISNAFDATQVLINPEDPEIAKFKKSLPQDGLALTILESKPKSLYVPKATEDWKRFPRKTIAQLLDSSEVGKAKLMCTILAIDTDWAWYYFGCRKCNKIVRKEIIEKPVSELLDGSFDEIEDPTNVPDAIKNIIGKTFGFGICVEKDNLDNDHNTYKVGKVLSDSEMEEDETVEALELSVTPSKIISGDQVTLMLTDSKESSNLGCQVSQIVKTTQNPTCHV